MPEQHEHQIFEVGVKALIFREECLLLVRRQDHPEWEMPGGRINVGEVMEETLLRELDEELPGGWDFTVGGIIHAQQANFMLPNGNGLMLLFLDVESQMPQEVDVSDEHEAAAWFSKDEFDDLDGVSPQVRAAGTRAFENRTRSIRSWEDLLP